VATLSSLLFLRCLQLQQFQLLHTTSLFAYTVKLQALVLFLHTTSNRSKSADPNPILQLLLVDSSSLLVLSDAGHHQKQSPFLLCYRPPARLQLPPGDFPPRWELHQISSSGRARDSSALESRHHPPLRQL
jgi:hypothetical protein